MKTPIQITFQHFPSSDALDVAIREEADGLDRYFDSITSCHVTVCEPHRTHLPGRLYCVKIHLAVPGNEVVVDRSCGKEAGHRDPYVAVREAFHAARRQLEDYARMLRGDVKHHEDANGGKRTIIEIGKRL